MTQGVGSSSPHTAPAEARWLFLKRDMTHSLLRRAVSIIQVAPPTHPGPSGQSLSFFFRAPIGVWFNERGIVMVEPTSGRPCTTDEFIRRVMESGDITIEDRSLLERKLAKCLRNSTSMAEALASAKKTEALSEVELRLHLMPEDKLITAQELAELLDWHVGTVYRMARAGTIPSVIVGDRSRRFRVGELRRWIQRKH